MFQDSTRENDCCSLILKKNASNLIKTPDMKPQKLDDQKMHLNLKLKDKKKDKILARWTDGLFYFVKVNRVSPVSGKCMVEFEDQSTADVDFKDLLEEKQEGLTQCHFCFKEDSKPKDQLVRCSNCERDYHQSCHVPPITDEEMVEKFVCRICVFASCAQAGGAKSSGHLAEKYAIMKQHFPYDIEYLTWNAGHTSNMEHCFCYCGGPGIWYNKMLQCCRCRQWFHEACIQSLKEELLIGDRFYFFACAHCNFGIEFLQRMELDWMTITHVTVFHLVMTMGTRYVDLDTDIVPFVMDKHQTFGFKRLINGMHGSQDAIRRILLKILQKNSSIFCCGAEVKKRCTYFGVRERTPPPVPPFSIPVVEHIITSESLKETSLKSITFNPSQFNSSVPYVLRGAKKDVPPSLSARFKESKLAKIARVKSEHNYCTPVKCQEEIPIKRGRKSPTPTHIMADIDANNNSPAKNSPEKSDSIPEEICNDVPSDNSSVKSEQKSSGDKDKGILAAKSSCRVLTYPEEQPKKSFWSLDTAIPEPSSFTGANHPFLTSFEQDNIRQKRKHFEEELLRLSSVIYKDDSSSRDIKKDIPLVSPHPDMNIKGFKGELAELINAFKPSKKSRTLSNECNSLPEKLSVRTSPSHLETSPRIPRASSLSTKTSKLLSLSPHINSQKLSFKNGFNHRKQESSSTLKSSELLDKVAEKRLKALSRCLKNLSPTCGFRFPVLEEKHPPVASSTSLAVTSVPDSSPIKTSSSPKCNKSSLGRLKDARGKKRKICLSDNLKDEMMDSVRRSNRSRHAVKRLEASIGSKSYDYCERLQSTSSGRANADHYEVISLRIRPDNNIVEYLVDWTQQ
ncbi:PHD finger protein 19-like [Biomphalaria glabrata]|uniref:PHD finger protein 19-like n=1 Tax=Biomphalaria glabrata TaxID=6526 RepID=A0A9W3BDP9_BIOGL|nr:PHD finger protein 19-like [Biomphalaria glabrata]KAI8779373.1 polycomb protein Pcl [Biomphalaria glabrata]